MDTATSNGESSQISSFFSPFHRVPSVGMHSSLLNLSPTLNTSFALTQDKHLTNSTIIVDDSTILPPELDMKVNGAYVL